MKPEEAKLVEACLKKDQRAMKQLYDRYAPALYGICLRYSHSDEDAKDWFQDGFIKVFENLNKLHDHESLYAWMRSIFINTALSALRPVKNNMEIQMDNDEIDSMADFYPTSEQFDRLDVNIILDAIQKLTPALRLVFNLCEIDGLSFSEAAEVAGVSESTVRANLARAKQQLSKDLEKYLK